MTDTPIKIIISNQYPLAYDFFIHFQDPHSSSQLIKTSDALYFESNLTEPDIASPFSIYSADFPANRAIFPNTPSRTTILRNVASGVSLAVYANNTGALDNSQILKTFRIWGAPSVLGVSQSAPYQNLLPISLSPERAGFSFAEISWQILSPTAKLANFSVRSDHGLSSRIFIRVYHTTFINDIYQDNLPRDRPTPIPTTGFWPTAVDRTTYSSAHPVIAADRYTASTSIRPVNFSRYNALLNLPSRAYYESAINNPLRFHAARLLVADSIRRSRLIRAGNLSITANETAIFAQLPSYTSWLRRRNTPGPFLTQTWALDETYASDVDPEFDLNNGEGYGFYENNAATPWAGNSTDARGLNTVFPVLAREYSSGAFTSIGGLLQPVDGPANPIGPPASSVDPRPKWWADPPEDNPTWLLDSSSSAIFGFSNASNNSAIIEIAFAPLNFLDGRTEVVPAVPVDLVNTGFTGFPYNNAVNPVIVGIRNDGGAAVKAGSLLYFWGGLFGQNAVSLATASLNFGNLADSVPVSLNYFTDHEGVIYIPESVPDLPAKIFIQWPEIFNTNPVSYSPGFVLVNTNPPVLGSANPEILPVDDQHTGNKLRITGINLQPGMKVRLTKLIPASPVITELLVSSDTFILPTEILIDLPPDFRVPGTQFRVELLNSAGLSEESVVLTIPFVAPPFVPDDTPLPDNDAAAETAAIIASFLFLAGLFVLLFFILSKM